MSEDTPINENTNMSLGLLRTILGVVCVVSIAAGGWAWGIQSAIQDITRDVDEIEKLVLTNMGSRFTSDHARTAFLQLSIDNPELIVRDPIDNHVVSKKKEN